MNSPTESLIILAFIIIVARFIKRRSKILCKYFIPSSLIAGLIGLLLGPQILGLISEEVTSYWSMMPKYLITVVFAGLFLGRIIPGAKEIWKQAGPQIAFGNTLAWGQYVMGLILTMFILTPFFGANPMTASLIEISFEGGHGTAAGLAPTFEKLGFTEGTDIALALATLSIFSVIISGVLILNWYRRKEGVNLSEEGLDKQQRQSIRSGYNLITVGKKISTTPRAVTINIIAFAASILIGWLILRGLVFFEELALSPFTDMRFFVYVPLFPLAMIGGLILQLNLRKRGFEKYIQRRTAEIISTLALDLLIATAVATLSLRTVGDNFATFSLLAIFGIGWIIFGFIYLAPRMFPSYWFEKGLTNVGQSMGTTATGLMLLRQADPSNKSKAKESFAYKQLVFEPFMGGGLITATSVVIIYKFGSWFFLVLSLAMTIFWYVFGLKIAKDKRKRLGEEKTASLPAEFSGSE